MIQKWYIKICPKKVDWSDLKSNLDKLQVDKLKNLPTNWINLESKVDKLDIDKLAPVPVDLSKLSDVVKNYVVKKNVYDAKIKTVGNKKSMLLIQLVMLLLMLK